MAEIIDARGLTEAEFLANYRPKNYPHPALTADICVYKAGPVPELLLVYRKFHPSACRWACPGGFVNKDEEAIAAAARELAEETGVEGLPLAPLALFSKAGRDPRDWVVSQAFIAIAEKDQLAEAGDDAARALWFKVTATKAEGRYQLSFSHGDTTLQLSFSAAHFPITGEPYPTNVESSDFAFDHAEIIARSYLSFEQARA